MTGPTVFGRKIGGADGADFRVEIALGIDNTAGQGLWAPDANEALWDEGLWNGSELYWIDVTSRALQVQFSTGRDRWEQRFRTGSATFVLDNQDGVFNPDGGRIGDVRFRPGRWIRIIGRPGEVVSSNGQFGFGDTLAGTNLAAAGFPTVDLVSGWEATMRFDTGPAGDRRWMLNAWSDVVLDRSLSVHRASPDDFIFPPLPGNNDNRIDTDRLTDADAGGVTISGTFTPGPGLGTANQTLAGNWSGNAPVRTWLLQLNTNSQLRFVFQDPINGQINTVHPSNLSDGVAYPFTVRWIPGSPVTIEVDGVLHTSAEIGDDMQLSAVPVMIGRQNSGGGFYDGTITTLRVTPDAGTPFRLDGRDVRVDGPLTVAWTDPDGNTLTPEGDINLDAGTTQPGEMVAAVETADGRFTARVAVPDNTDIDVTASWSPGSPIEISVVGIGSDSLPTTGILNTAAVPITFGSRADGGTDQGFVGTLIEATLATSGARARLSGADLEVNGSLDGVAWVDAVGTDWLGSGAVLLAGFASAIDYRSLFVGYIDTIEDIYSPGAGGINARMIAYDFLGNLAIDDPPALETPVPAELSSARVERLLTLADWPVELWEDTIDVGVFDVQSSDLAQSRLEEIQITADSEGGAFYVTGEGFFRFRSRDYLESPASSDVQFVIGDPSGEGVQIEDADTDWSTQRVSNDVRMARTGGQEQRATDDASIGLYQRRTFRRFNLENTNDVDVAFLVDRYLAAFRFDHLRIDSLHVIALSQQAAADLMGMNLADRVRVTVRTLPGWSYTMEAWINGFTFVVTADDWKVVMRVDNVDRTDPFDRSGFDSGFDEEGFGV